MPVLGPFGITSGADGNLWFICQVGGAVGRMNTSGVTLNLFPVTGPANNLSGIGIGPDNLTWFTEEQLGKIGKMPTSGLYTDFTLPIGSVGNPVGVCKGPSDGKVWFTQFEYTAIGKMDPDGSNQVSYVLPNPSAKNPYLITTGPDGRVWTSCQTGSALTAVTTSGTISVYPTLSAAGPIGICIGGDGNMWYAGSNNGKIGKMDTSGGSQAEYQIPGAAGGTGAIDCNLGSDGNVWFTSFLTNKVGKITPSGTITTYVLPTGGAGPEYICLGADGNMWFTEYNADQIGRITPSGIITEFAIGAGSTFTINLADGVTLADTKKFTTSKLLNDFIFKIEDFAGTISARTLNDEIKLGDWLSINRQPPRSDFGD